jgi:hypothetical protein
MISALEEIGALAHICIHHPTHPKKHEAARGRSLRRLVPHLVGEGVSHLMIEGRERHQDAVDSAVLLDSFRDLKTPQPFTYEWEGKHRAELWAADAVCGATREMAVGRAEYFQAMDAAGIIGGLYYINEPLP